MKFIFLHEHHFFWTQTNSTWCVEMCTHQVSLALFSCRARNIIFSFVWGATSIPAVARLSAPSHGHSEKSNIRAHRHQPNGAKQTDKDLKTQGRKWKGEKKMDTQTRSRLWNNQHTLPSPCQTIGSGRTGEFFSCLWDKTGSEKKEYVT